MVGPSSRPGAALPTAPGSWPRPQKVARRDFTMKMIYVIATIALVAVVIARVALSIT